MLAGAKPGLLTGEVDKLAAYVGDKEKIEPADVESLSAGSTMLNVFEVIDLMTAGRTDKAVSKLRMIFAEDKSAEYTIVGAFAYYFRKMFDAKVLLSRRMSASQVAGKLRIWKNKREFFNAIGNLSLKQIGEYISGLAETDYRIKTGRARPQTAIEQLVFDVSLNAQNQQKH
jgi:DNA polymerase-3 subunit delta